MLGALASTTDIGILIACVVYYSLEFFLCLRFQIASIFFPGAGMFGNTGNVCRMN